MTTCNYISSSGQKCKTRSLEYSNFCHKVSHNIDKDNFDKVKKNILHKFNNSTTDFSKSKIIDVISDGACLYYCMAIYLIKNNKNLNNLDFFNFVSNNSDIYSLLSDKFDEDFQIETINSDDFIELAINIQSILSKWLYSNKDRIFRDTGISISDLIMNCHDLTMEKYKEYYSVFAGDNDHIEIDGKIITLPDRWGSTPELYAFSILFNVKIDIYCLYRLHNYSIVECTIRAKNVKFKLSSTFNENNENSNTMNLLRSKKRGDYHYQYLNI